MRRDGGGSVKWAVSRMYGMLVRRNYRQRPYHNGLSHRQRSSLGCMVLVTCKLQMILSQDDEMHGIRKD